MAAEVAAKTDWIILLQTMLNLASPLGVLATVLISYWWGKTRLQNSERELQSLKDSLSTQVTALRKQIQTLEAITPGQILEQYRTTIDLINNTTQDQIQTLPNPHIRAPLPGSAGAAAFLQNSVRCGSDPDPSTAPTKRGRGDAGQWIFKFSIRRVSIPVSPG
ncbi:MAG: hypothetical protein HC921_04925 [Synechococcaceae cyanobacterium SM2_3_1]|nr:hypothetical protein [Synechococcaceae cyanobacterium SM2_3_1]